MKLICLSGLPGSGKSTVANQLSKKHGYVRVQSDWLRLQYPQLLPHEVTMVVIHFAGILMQLDHSVVIDACNLHPADRLRWEAVAAVFDAEFEWVELLTPVEECVRRDRLRLDPVGEERIVEMAKGASSCG